MRLRSRRRHPVSKAHYLSICPRDCAEICSVNTARWVFKPPPLSPPTEQLIRRLMEPPASQTATHTDARPAGHPPDWLHARPATRLAARLAARLAGRPTHPAGRRTPTHITAGFPCVIVSLGNWGMMPSPFYLFGNKKDGPKLKEKWPHIYFLITYNNVYFDTNVQMQT